MPNFEVKAAIDDMVAALLKEKADEIKHKDFCTEGLNTNERESELKARDIAELEAEISDLTTTIDELTKSIATLESAAPQVDGTPSFRLFRGDPSADLLVARGRSDVTRDKISLYRDGSMDHTWCQSAACGIPS